MKLSDKVCVACQGGIPPLKGKGITIFLKQLDKSWKVIKSHHLEREFTFKDFKEAWDFVNKVATVAEEQDHHPDIYLAWGKVKLTLWTHKINGLHESDFIFAAKVDKLA